jgi:anti-anti-sigma regulatory factor
METPKRRAIVCEIAALTGRPDATTIDALARLQLTLRPHGLEIVLSGASAELVELLGFVGLADVLRVEPGRQAEEREERGGVEEERELDDPSV